MTRNIKVSTRSCDGCRKSRTFKTLTGAQRFAHHWVGETPDVGSSYAVANDGILILYVSGTTLKELFPKSATW